MKHVRNSLAFPFYFIAFVLHLLCAAFTVMALKIAGEESGPSSRAEIISLMVFCCAVVSAAPLYVLTRPVPVVDMTLLVPQAPMPSWRSVPTGFLPEQEVWTRPLVRLTACIFAERVIRHELDPATIEFAPCGGDGMNAITLDDAYFEATVSGVAKVNGVDRAFQVSLNHYPPSTSEWGFITTGLTIEREDTRISCAASSN